MHFEGWYVEAWGYAQGVLGRWAATPRLAATGPT